MHENVNMGADTQHRIYWVDYLRAFSVFCVVLGHTLRNATSVYPWLYCFHVPLCVMVSGIVFRKGAKKTGAFVRNKFAILMVPYYCFGLVSIVLYYFLGSMMETAVGGGYDLSLVDSFIGLIFANSGTGLMRWNMPLWYLPMLFVLLLFAWIIFDDTVSIKMHWIIFAISVMIAYCCYEFVQLPDLPFGIETMIYLFPFFVEGKLIGRYVTILHAQKKEIRSVLGIVLVVVATVMSLGEGQISYNADHYGEHGYLFFMVMSSAFCVGFSYLFSVIGNGWHFLTFFGRNTMGVMVMHKFPILFFVSVLPISKRAINTAPLISAIVIAVISVVMCLVASEIICRVCPFVLGRKRTHDRKNNLLT